MKKQNVVFAAVIAGVVAAAGTMVAVALKVKERKDAAEKVELEKEAAGVEPIEETDGSEEDDDESAFTLSDDEDVVADGDVVVMDTPEVTETVKKEDEEPKAETETEIDS